MIKNTLPLGDEKLYEVSHGVQNSELPQLQELAADSFFDFSRQGGNGGSGRLNVLSRTFCRSYKVPHFETKSN